MSGCLIHHYRHYSVESPLRSGAKGKQSTQKYFQLVYNKFIIDFNFFKGRIHKNELDI